jgi:hypothetical protein
LVSPDDEHIVLKTCRELEINKYIERNWMHQVGYLPGIAHRCQITKYQISCYDQEKVDIHMTNAALINVVNCKEMLL